jgi:thiosulfate reductase cytochrome b subunit
MANDMTDDKAANDIAHVKVGVLMKRHRLSTRIWHWLNFVTLIIMLMSGLMIFNAHPRLYWGQYGANNDPAWLEIGSSAGVNGGQKEGGGYLQIGDVRINTAGVLGSYDDKDGQRQAHAFPYWATIPSGYNLSFARLWHFAFAWVLSLALLFYILRSLFNGHVKRDLHIRKAQWSPRHIWGDIKDHAQLKFPSGAAALEYNILQKLSYIGVIFILLPLMIFTGLTMSPAMNAAWPWLLDLFGGRQSARSLHFIAAFALIAFFIVHIIMVLLAGPLNEIRAMITGNYRLPVRRGENSGEQEEAVR